jgi:hypothetical protein
LTGTPVTSVVKIAPDTGGGAASPVATETARTTAIDPAVATATNLRWLHDILL